MKQCVRIFQLVAGSNTAVPKEQEQALKNYADGYAAYCVQHWDGSLGLFNKSLKMWPDEGPSKAMAASIKGNGNSIGIVSD